MRRAPVYRSLFVLAEPLALLAAENAGIIGIKSKVSAEIVFTALAYNLIRRRHHLRHSFGPQ